MPEFRIVLIEPEYEINIGYCARILKNFGFSELFIVKPKVKIGFKAKMFSKHGVDILKNAKKVNNIKEALKNCELVVGTTGKPKKDIHPITPKSFVKQIQKLKGKVALLFGREGTGLNKNEIELCDFLVSIPANPEYPVLNISHALCIILYELFSLKEKKFVKGASKKEKELLLQVFNKMVDKFAKNLRNPEKIKLAYKRVIGKSIISSFEARAILCAFKKFSHFL